MLGLREDRQHEHPPAAVVNGAYQVLDLAPKGRDEAGLSYTMEWLQRHDAYGPVVIAKGLSKRP